MRLRMAVKNRAQRQSERLSLGPDSRIEAPFHGERANQAFDRGKTKTRYHRPHDDRGPYGPPMSALGYPKHLHLDHRRVTRADNTGSLPRLMDGFYPL